jgi:hypothetical protein
LRSANANANRRLHHDSDSDDENDKSLSTICPGLKYPALDEWLKTVITKEAEYEFCLQKFNEKSVSDLEALFYETKPDSIETRFGIPWGNALKIFKALKVTKEELKTNWELEH